METYKRSECSNMIVPIQHNTDVETFMMDSFPVASSVEMVEWARARVRHIERRLFPGETLAQLSMETERAWDTVAAGVGAEASALRRILVGLLGVPEKHQLVLLALLGWKVKDKEEDSAGALEGRARVLVCGSCRRQVGLWAHESVGEEGPTGGAKRQRLSGSDVGAVAGTTSTLNPVTAHRLYCPWVHAVASTDTACVRVCTLLLADRPATGSLSRAHDVPRNTTERKHLTHCLFHSPRPRMRRSRRCLAGLSEV